MTGLGQSLRDPQSLMKGGKLWGNIPGSDCGRVCRSGAEVSCCFDHDCCYGEAQNAGCNPYLQYYGYNCENGTANCGCAKMVCECDLQAALCLQRCPYNSFFRRWPPGLCIGSSPQCQK
uniref:Phospholipase A2 n=1 Tax=Eptatretus burgeri TaxID=7764 RepID=A0A8C4RAK5_EPTBU